MSPDTPTNHLVDAAYALARRAHAGQFRRDGTTPFMRHVDAVMARAPKDPVSQAVAACHDAREDAPDRVSVADLERLSPEVASGVLALTRRDGETYNGFIERVRVTDDGRWAAIKIADLLSNLSDSPLASQIRRYATALLVLVPRT